MEPACYKHVALNLPLVCTVVASNTNPYIANMYTYMYVCILKYMYNIRKMIINVWRMYVYVFKSLYIRILYMYICVMHMYICIMYACIYVFTFKLWFHGQNSKTSKCQMLAIYIYIYIVVWKIFVWNYFVAKNICEKNFRGFPISTKIF